MRKKILSLIMIGSLSLTITGCKADNTDFETQVEKMNQIIEDGKLFEKDYQLKASMFTILNGKKTEIDYHFERDGNNYWLEMDTDSDLEELDEDIEIWVGKKDEKYYAFYEYDNKKEYNEISSTQVNNLIDSKMNLNNFESNLQDNYLSMVELISETMAECQKDGVVCTYDKSLFGTVTLTMSQQDDADKTEVIISIRKGKLRKLVMKNAKLYEYADCGSRKNTVLGIL